MESPNPSGPETSGSSPSGSEPSAAHEGSAGALDAFWAHPLETAAPGKFLDCGSPQSRPPLSASDAPGHELVITSLESVRLLAGLRGVLGARRVHLVDYPGSVISVSPRVGAALIASRSVQRRLGRLPGAALLSERLFGHRLAPTWPDPDATLALAQQAVARPAPVVAGRGTVHYIGTLGAGGAERQLSYLVARQPAPRRVLTAAPLEGAAAHYAPDVRSAGVECLSVPRLLRSSVLPELGLDLATRALVERHCQRDLLGPLIEALRRDPPAVLHCWLDDCNVVGAVAGLLVGVPRIVIGTRNLNPSHFPALYRSWLRGTYAALSTSPRVFLTANSAAGGADYAAWCGAPVDAFQVIPNGLDLERWAPPASDERARARADLKVSEDRLLVVGAFRLSDEKRPLDFLEVIAAARREIPGLLALHVGHGPMNSAFAARAAELGLTGPGGALRILGRRRDVSTILAAADLSLLCSAQEGCPNVLLEAHAMGVPAVTTCAGGAPDVVEDGETGFVLPIGDVAGLSAALARLANPDLRARAGRAARARIVERFSVEVMVNAYRDLYQRAPP